MATSIYLGNPPENIKKWIKEEAERKQQEKLKEPLCFTAEEPNATMKFNKDDYAYYDNQVVFSYDKQNWSNYEYGTDITLANVGDKVYFRAADGVENWSFNSYEFYIRNGKIAASGNLNTLLKADGSILDLTVERWNCYANMFNYCISLTKAPELPATTLAEYCYSHMFENCKSLTKAPELPATTLANNCYDGMFTNCASLTQVPALPATTLADNCYYDMFSGCAFTQILLILPATELASGCYANMFSYCESLTQAPELPATELASGCYSGMFTSCFALTQASFPNLEKETVASEIVEGQYAFGQAASDIEATCKDGILVINSTAV